MSPHKEKLIALLEELFQLNQPELDFGLYRILHARSSQIKAFIQNELATEIDKIFAGQYQASVHDQLQAARHKIEQTLGDYALEANGQLKPEFAKIKIGQEYEAIRQQAQQGGGPLADDAQIYDHLYRFFSRYYDKGDFMSRRYFVSENDSRALPYAIPYDGREVMLHWANKDQYYIKSSEYLANFTVDLAAAQKIAGQGGQAGLDFAAPAESLTAHFRLAAATEGEHNNVKEGQERYFLIHSPEPLKLEQNAQGQAELVIQFQYRPDPEKTGQAGTWQQKRLLEAEAAIQAALAKLPEADAHRTALFTPAPTDKQPKRTLLGKYLGQYTSRNTMDYFIHKNLGGFLRRELDFYIKNEIMRLDDIENAAAPRVETYLNKLKSLRKIARRIIDFLAQIEDFQKKLWLKKKFVVETNYCITLDRIPEAFYPEIAANDAQREEWVRLFAIDEIVADTTTPGYSVPLTVEFLRANRFLMVDTALLGESLKAALLASQENLDENLDGLLIHSDNFQALNFIQKKSNKKIKCIYIDPPYNTGDDGFPYKDGYRHSSWMSMLENRIIKSAELMSDNGIFFSSIDRDENRNYLPLLFSIFGEENFIEEIVWQKSYGGGAKTKHINNLHEYIHAFAKNRPSVPYLTLPPDAGTIKYYKHKDEKLPTRGEYRTQPLNTNSNDYRRNLTYPLPTPAIELYGSKKWEKGVLHIGLLLNNGELELFGDIDSGWYYKYSNGASWDGGTLHPARQWQWSWEKTKDALINNEIIIESKSGEWSVNYKQYRFDENGEERGRKPSSINIGPYTQSGTDELRNMFGRDVSKYPKPCGLIKEIVSIDYKDNDATFLDYFGGSGTTGQSIIEANRENPGKRRYILIEMGEHFDTVLKPRIQKSTYASNWKNGKPVARDGISHCFKYLRLESYEDTLNNLLLPHNPAVDLDNPQNADLARDYLLKYWLDFETAGSPSLLNVRQFADPTAYRLKVKQPGSEAQVEKSVDLIETFNWLIGLHVAQLDRPRRYAATLVRALDPDLPKDQDTRWVCQRIDEQDEGEFWFRWVEGHVLAVPGDETSRQRVLVLWRKLTGEAGRDQAVLEAYLAKKKLNPLESEFETIYINGSHALPSNGNAATRVRLIEETFAQRMWEDA